MTQDVLLRGTRRGEESEVLLHLPDKNFASLQSQGRSKADWRMCSQEVFDLYEMYYFLSLAREPSKQDRHLLAQIATIPRERLASLPEVLLRVQAFQQQLSSSVPLFFHPLSLSPQKIGACGLCCKPLGPDERFRCAFCALALRLILGFQTLCEWLLPENCGQGSEERDADRSMALSLPSADEEPLSTDGESRRNGILPTSPQDVEPDERGS